MIATIFLKAQPNTQTVGRIINNESNPHRHLSTLAEREYDLMTGSVSDASPIVSNYSRHETTRGLDLHLNESIPGSLNGMIDAPCNSEIGYLRSTPATFQKNLFIKNISLKSVAFRRAVLAPVLLTAAGLSILDDDSDDNYEVQAERNRYIPRFRYHVDDYLQHFPIVVVYGLNGLGVKSKNDFANRTAILIKSEMMVGILTFSLKRVTAVPRPDTGELTSLPSGHTAQAFATATFLAKEYGHKSIWYSIGGYTMATGVGAMRVMNNRHWVSDVLVGAGIGILSTNLVYLTHQYRWGKKSKGGQTSVMPSYDGQTGMINIIHRIN